MSAVSRRTLLSGALGGGLITGGVFSGGLPAAAAAPRLSRGGRPMLTHGLQSGDVTADSATIWTRVPSSSVRLAGKAGCAVEVTSG